MTPTWRRLLVPLALSLLGHALLFYVLGLVPRVEQEAPPARREGPPLTMSLSGPTRQVAKATIHPEEYVDIDFDPKVVIPSTPAVGSTDHSLEPTISSPGGAKGIGSGTAGPRAGSAVVVVPPAARRVVFLLDRSGSMGLFDALDRAKAELAAALAALPPETSFQVVAYNSGAWPLVGSALDLVPANGENVARAHQQLDLLLASGFTRHVEAVRAALLLRPDLLVLLTDADDLSLGDVRLMTNANRSRAVLDVVELTRDPQSRPDGGLASLAALNRGRHRRVLLGR